MHQVLCRLPRLSFPGLDCFTDYVQPPLIVTMTTIIRAPATGITKQNSCRLPRGNGGAGNRERQRLVFLRHPLKWKGYLKGKYRKQGYAADNLGNGENHRVKL